MFQNEVIWCQQTPHFKHSSEEDEWDSRLDLKPTLLEAQRHEVSNDTAKVGLKVLVSENPSAQMEGVLAAYRRSQIIKIQEAPVSIKLNKKKQQTF